MLVNTLTIRAKAHLKRKAEVMKDLMYVWESQRLKLIEILAEPANEGKVSPYVYDKIANFEDLIREKILDIIYNSQLNNFIIQKFDIMKERENL